MTAANKIRVGISSCLLGQKVRYNGAHKRDRYINEVLADVFEFVPFCPEVAIGLGVPRPPIRLTGPEKEPRAEITGNASLPAGDVTAALAAYARQVSAEIESLSAYILKSGSPSCGMERVKVYDKNASPSGRSSGIYAKTLMDSHPLLPVEEEGRLNDVTLRDNFLQRVFVYHRWQQLQLQGLDAARLIAFHTEHKLLLMAHDQEIYRELGRLLAGAGKASMADLAPLYITRMMDALKQPATAGSHSNVLMHMLGYFKKTLDQADRKELLEAIEAYRAGAVSLIVPLTLFRHHIRRQAQSYLANQQYIGHAEITQKTHYALPERRKNP